MTGTISPAAACLVGFEFLNNAALLDIWCISFCRAVNYATSDTRGDRKCNNVTAVEGSSLVKTAIESTHLNLNPIRELIITSGTLPNKNTRAKFSLHQLFLYQFFFLFVVLFVFFSFPRSVL